MARDDDDRKQRGSGEVEDEVPHEAVEELLDENDEEDDDLAQLAEGDGDDKWE